MASDVSRELMQYVKTIDAQIDSIDRSLATASEEVDSDLESIIDTKLALSDYSKIREKLNAFKEANRAILLKSKFDSLRRAKAQLVQLKKDILVSLPEKEDSAVVSSPT
jgi:hypothetical protein